MPFKKTGPDEYQGPSGKKFNEKQVRLSYATDNFTHMGKAKKLNHKKVSLKK